MGFDLHITRAEDWTDNVGREIEKSEWLELVRDDPELILDPRHGDCAVLWQHERHPEDPWLDWCAGNVYTTDPTRAMVEKMLQLAARLDARLLGDDGVTYRSPSQWRD